MEKLQGLLVNMIRSPVTGEATARTASVGAAKQRKLVQTAQMFLQAHARLAALPCRFDVIGCAGTPQQPAFEWTRNAFEAV